MTFCNELEKLNNAFNDVCNGIKNAMLESIKATEKEIGRPLTKNEFDFCLKIGVPFCILTILKKGERDGCKKENV